MDYQFREATQADIPFLKIIRDGVKENRLVNLKIEEADYIVPMFEDGKAWVALQGNTIVGFSCGRIIQADVWALFVDPQHEGRGVGNRLMELLENWMFNQKSCELITLTTQQKTRAEALYRRRGWVFQCSLRNGEGKFLLSKEVWLERPS